MGGRTMDRYPYIDQSAVVENMIASSLYRCNNRGLPELYKLPEVSKEDVSRCQNLVTGHIWLMRKSSPEYYAQQINALSVNNACIMYVHSSFDVFGRFGNADLLRELKKKNLFTGANLGEYVVGTNAAVLADRCQHGVWVIGEDNYAKALKDYAFYAFRVNAKYLRTGIIMFATPVRNLDARIVALFKLLESTESIISVGSTAEDVRLKDIALSNQSGRHSTDDICLIVGADGTITYANYAFCEAFNTKELDIISTNLSDVIPALVPQFNKAMTSYRQNVEGFVLNIDNTANKYSAKLSPIEDKGKFVGCIITLCKENTKSASGKAHGNVAKYGFDDLIGTSQPFTQLKWFANRVAQTESAVLIQGESGTGKELFAHAIHNASERKNESFIAINCSAIPKELIGSELFGYVPGSFTGASKSGAKGKFEQADKGTLFLDEIGEMPLEMQSVLLRVLEAREVTRIGATMPIPVDVRIIAATNRNLASYVKEGKFRADLYYRLNVVNLVIMPLRERKEDIPALIDLFMKSSARKNRVQVYGVKSEAIKALIEYEWPGNVRELRNVIERCVIMSKDGYINLDDLPAEIAKKSLPPQATGLQNDEPLHEESKRFLPELVAAHRKEIAERLLAENDGNKTLVAEKMGVSRSTLYRILKA